MADITMELINYQTLINDETTKVSFGRIPEPVTTDALVEIFIRFAQACGFSERSVAESMLTSGWERYPEGKKDNGDNNE